jgi:hypothetical protein
MLITERGPIVRLAMTAIALAAIPLCESGAVGTVELNGGKCPIVDGKPFFVVGIYSAEIADFPTLAKAGFNLVHTYQWEHERTEGSWGKAWLDAAAANGLKSLVGLYRPSVQSGDVASCTQRIEAFRQHPALFAWHTMDEPPWDEKGNMGKEYMPAAYSLIKKHDPHHPVTAVVCHFDDCRRFENSVDAMQADYYPVPTIPASEYLGSGFRGIKRYADAWREASGGKKPFWFVAQAFDYTVWKDRDKDINTTEEWLTKATQEWKRFPTRQELRTMTYLAVASGARGVFYWSLQSLRDTVRPYDADAKQRWERLQSVTLELKHLMPMLTADTKEVITEKDSVVAMVKSDGKDTYVIAANYERKPTETIVEIPGIDAATADVVFGQGSTEIRSGKLAVRLDSVESRVYKIVRK